MERDTLGEVQVPQWALWGASTARAVDNFAVTGGALLMPRRVIHALGSVKAAAARANCDLGLLPPRLASAVVAAADKARSARAAPSCCTLLLCLPLGFAFRC